MRISAGTARPRDAPRHEGHVSRWPSCTTRACTPGAAADRVGPCGRRELAVKRSDMRATRRTRPTRPPQRAPSRGLVSPPQVASDGTGYRAVTLRATSLLRVWSTATCCREKRRNPDEEPSRRPTGALAAAQACKGAWSATITPADNGHAWRTDGARGVKAPGVQRCWRQSTSGRGAGPGRPCRTVLGGAEASSLRDSSLTGARGRGGPGDPYSEARGDLRITCHRPRSGLPL
jgi:hypothetical protein